MFAVIKTGGKQYKVKVGSVLKVEKLKVNEFKFRSRNERSSISR